VKHFLVCNPGSRGRRGGRLAEAYRAMLSRRGADFEFGTTLDLDDAEHLARSAADDGFDAVVAVGGDGTINRVVNGLMNAQSSRAPRPGLGVLYAGTSPDFCRFHRLPVRPEEAVAALVSGRTRTIDLCRIRCRDAAGRESASFFACSANLGLGAGIAARANRWRKRLGDFTGTLAAVASTVLRCRPRSYRLTIDGTALVTEETLNVTVGKNPFLASGLRLQIDADPGDGALYYFAIRGLSRAGFLMSLPRFYSGSIARDRRFLLGRATTVKVEPLGADGSVEAEFDGDPAGFGPAEIEVVPRALSLWGAS